MAKLQSEIEVTCPCCSATLVIDTNLGRVIEHRDPERAQKPYLEHAHRLVQEEAERLESIFR